MPPLGVEAILVLEVEGVLVALLRLGLRVNPTTQLATFHACSTFMLAYFDLLAAGHSAELGEEAELGMTKENEHKAV
jgi:hypothetical protein